MTLTVLQNCHKWQCNMAELHSYWSITRNRENENDKSHNKPRDVENGVVEEVMHDNKRSL